MPKNGRVVALDSTWKSTNVSGWFKTDAPLPAAPAPRVTGRIELPAQDAADEHHLAALRTAALPLRT